MRSAAPSSAPTGAVPSSPLAQQRGSREPDRWSTCPELRPLCCLYAQTPVSHHRLRTPGWPALPCPRSDSRAPCACSGLIKFRRAHPLLGRAEFLGPQDITWHEEHWDNPESKFLAFSLHDRCAGRCCYRAHGRRGRQYACEDCWLTMLLCRDSFPSDSARRLRRRASLSANFFPKLFV